MDESTSLFDPGLEGSLFSDPPPEDVQPAPAEPAAPAVPAIDPAEFIRMQERLSATQQELERLRQAPPAVPQPPSFGADQMAEAMRRIDQERQAMARAAQEMAPPTWTAEDREEFYVNPDKAIAKIREAAAYESRVRMAELAPYVQSLQQQASQAQALLPLIEPLTAYGMEMAEDRARRMAKTQGVTEEDFNRYLPEARQYLYLAARNDEVQYRRMALNPEAIYMAANAVAARSPRPVQQPSPVAPSTASAANPALAGTAAPIRTEEIERMEQAFGKRSDGKSIFDDAWLKDFNARRNGRVN